MTLQAVLNAVGQFISPLQDYTLTTGFGVPAAMGGEIHDGQDFAAPAGTPIYAPADGTVKRSFWNEGGGNVLEIVHNNGILTGYAHAQRFIVKAGDAVKQGQLIGYVGSTGSLVTGPHLHFYAEQGGRKIDPLTIFDELADVPKSVYQDLVGDFVDWLRNSTSESIGKQTWGEYATGFNTDFIGAPVNSTMLQAAVGKLGWENRTIEAGDIAKVAEALSQIGPTKPPWDVAAEAASNIAAAVGAVVGFVIEPVNWARLIALLVGIALAFVGFRSMWSAGNALSA